ncbi:MAG: Ku protein [Thermoplasmata archaeon]
MMPRAVWSGAIAFGLVNIPVKLFTAIRKKDISFRSLHTECNTPLKRPYYCPTCEVQVSYDDIQKGYEYAKGQYVILVDEDFQKVPLESSKALEVQGFVDREEVDPILYESTYYLAPTETSVKPFELFRQALELTNKAAVAQATIWKKEQVVIIRPRGNHLVLSTLYYEDDVREPPAIPAEKPVTVSEGEVELALNLIQTLTAPFDMSKFKDRYREAILEVIEAKVEGREVEAPAVEQRESPEDLMAALKASLESVKKPS